jgi:hypothetical protein
MLAAADELIRFTKRMEHAGMPAQQAQEQSAAIIDLVSSLHDSNKAVTQDDLFRVESKLEAKISALDMKVETKFGSLDAKIEAKNLETKAEISNAKADIIKWMLGQNALILIAILGLAGTLLHK